MNLSMKWLDDYCKLGNISMHDFSEGMTMSGSKVETYEQEGAELQNIVVGKILSLEKHPDSDHLWICSVDIGAEETVQIVTGAQNLKVGDYVPAALHNSVIHGGKKIKKGKLRGVESNGMLCSLGELGLTVHDFPNAIEDGIFVLDDECDLTLGKDIQSAIGLNDNVVEFEITSNRPDCLSVIGLAREAAVTFGKEFLKPYPPLIPGEGNADDYLHVSIENSTLCYRYAAAIVKNIRVKPSPRWMRERLRASGVRPINNIVDITNYVMLEYGHPMHAFDLRFIDNSDIIVRNAKNGEKITTLDGIERELSDDMLVIADANKPVAVAGVMGGEYSGIMDDTNTIVFESACFNGASVRVTAKKLGMRTEASSRFEKELDPNTCIPALARALELVRELDAGDVIGEIIDCDKSSHEVRSLPLNVDWINNFLGISISCDEMQKILKDLEFSVVNGGKYPNIIAPHFRNDIEHLADIAEEIARIYGYNKIPSTPLRGCAEGKFTEMQKYIRLINRTLVGLGLSEIFTYSFVSPKIYDKICLPADSPLRNSVVITNPLGEDTSVMRTTSIPSMLEVLSRNYNNRNMAASLYEIAKDFTPIEGEQLPAESEKIVIGLYGDSSDYYSLKGIVEELLEALSIKNYDLAPVTDNPTFHPGRTASISVNGSELGIMGEVHPAVLENYGLETRAYIAVIDIKTAFDASDFEKLYKPLPKFPATTRDLAFICDKNVPVMDVERIISDAVGGILEEIVLFDVYTGKQIASDKKSIAFSLKMRSAVTTLTDEEADAATNRAIKALAKHNIELRS